jgi:3-isopropylmalate/(R)-2-methylmalate dehydratase small subunit
VQLHLEGRARRLGNNINTDYIISSTRKRETLDESVLKRYLLETVDPSFADSVQAGDLLVAGRNFGCGSAMEIAVTVILAAGIKGVLAQTFARTFYRNAINSGLVPVEVDTSRIHETQRQVLVGHPLATTMLEILEAGGLVPYVRVHGRLVDRQA